MSDEPEQTSNVTHLVRYEITLDQIQAMGAKYRALTCETPEAYEETRQAIAVLRTTRGSIEDRRKELKAGALEYGRKVDSVSKQLTAAIVAIEEPLKAKKAEVDEEKARAKREAEEAERRALEEQIRQQREAEDARLKWRASPWGPACGIVVKDEGAVLEVLEGELTVRLHLPSFSVEHAPRVVGRVTDETRPAFAQPVWGAR